MAACEVLSAKRDEVLRLAEMHGARNVRLVGSCARGDARPDSDVDIIVEFDPDRSLLDHVALTQDLVDLLGRKVDVISAGALHWYIRDRVLQEAVPL